MIKTRTLFILGAGASAPYGYPTGGKLREVICKEFGRRMNVLCRPKYPFDKLEQTLKDIDNFINVFFNSSTPSIDLFLARNKNFSEIGKKAIVSSILSAEKESKFRENIEEKKRSQDWYSYLYSRMTENLIRPDSYNYFSRTNNVNFITFNYDRSLEHFFYESLLHSFSDAPQGRIIQELNNIRIYYIYGVVSKLPWQGGDLEYGSSFDIDHIDKLKDNIKIVYERNASSIADLELLIENAERLFFLGFGYAKENIDILNILQYLTGNIQIYGTAYGLSKREIYEKRSLLKQNFKDKAPDFDNPIIEDTDCLGLLKEHL